LAKRWLVKDLGFMGGSATFLRRWLPGGGRSGDREAMPRGGIGDLRQVAKKVGAGSVSGLDWRFGSGSGWIRDGPVFTGVVWRKLAGHGRFARIG
jgi:hypothetical protein